MLNQLWSNRFVRFIVIGVINTVFGYAIFATFLFLGFSYILAITFGTIIAILFNFKTIGVVVFKSHNNDLIIKFFAVYGITYLFNLVGLSIFNHYHISNYVAGAILVLPAAIIGFLLNRRFVFKTNLVSNNQS
ncbi:MAG: GtrA family protein [Candidatus Taylorbacteria bacterium]